MIRECKRNNVCFSDKGAESGRDIESDNTRMYICVIVTILACPCKFSRVMVSVTPYISHVILLHNTM